ncbi:MAG: hypothetical protein M2R46_03258 [Verrucomicrobia subdivision 3 bacterium]|nr:hypothetical protein [Limisphaerales bacterium]
MRVTVSGTGYLNEVVVIFLRRTSSVRGSVLGDLILRAFHLGRTTGVVSKEAEKTRV